MKIGVIGTGTVGQTIAAALADKKHDVLIGTRDPKATMARDAGGPMGGGPFRDWAAAHPAIGLRTIREAASHGELVFFATQGASAVAAVQAAGAALDGKIVVDISNPLDFSKGFPPFLFVGNTDSLGEQMQQAAPKARIVKSLNTVTAALMVNPRALAGGAHTMFVAGNDADAKATVTTFLMEQFGWSDVVDIGGIEAARATESLLLPWTRLYGALKTPLFGFHVVR